MYLISSCVVITLSITLIFSRSLILFNLRSLINESLLNTIFVWITYEDTIAHIQSILEIILTTLLVDYHLDKVETNNTFRGMISSIKIHQILIVSIPNSIENPRNPCFTRFFYTIYCRKYTILLVCRLLYMTFH